MIEFKLPFLGADMDEGTLLEWKISPGDAVKRGQIVAVVDTSKAAVEVECWQEGIVHRLLTRLEQTIPVGTPMALFLAPGEQPQAAAPAAEAVPAPPPPAAATMPAAAVPAFAGAAPPGVAFAPEAPATRARISPAARRRAAELHVDIGAIASGSGPKGAIAIADVERAARTMPATGAAARRPAGGDRATEMRRLIAAAMSRSKREIPHYYLAETIPLRRTLDWLGAENARRPMAQRLLVAVPLLKAVAVTLHKFPELNGHYREGTFQPAPSVHIGVAISIRQGGLIAPAIHDVATKKLDELMSALGDLIQRARAGSLRSSELSDATVTVTSLGDRGVEFVQGVINPPQVALVGFGRISERPWAADGAVVALPAVTASLAADHRVSDGHRGALFLAALRDLLQQPERLSEAT